MTPPLASVIRWFGEIDINERDGLRRDALALLDTTSGDVVVDLAAVTYLDSAGLGVLADIARRTCNEQRAMRITGAQGLVRHLLDIAGFAAMPITIDA